MLRLSAVSVFGIKRRSLFLNGMTRFISCLWMPSLHHQSLGGGRDGGGPRRPGGARVGGGPGGGWTTEGGEREGGVVRGPLDGGFVRGTELETRGCCSTVAGGEGGGGGGVRCVRGGARLFWVDWPSFTRWKLIQRPCQDTHKHQLNHDTSPFQGRIQIKIQRVSVQNQSVSKIHRPEWFVWVCA